jgi:hypothetical protein
VDLKISLNEFLVERQRPFVQSRLNQVICLSKSDQIGVISYHAKSTSVNPHTPIGVLSVLKLSSRTAAD